MSETQDDKASHDPEGQARQDGSPDRGEAGAGISDDQLPEDLRPTDDNPLAQPLPEGEEADLDVQAELEERPNTDGPDGGDDSGD